MEGFTYHNIFETKGIEYLVIIGFLILMVPFWFVLNRQTSVVAELKTAINVLSEKYLRIPQGIFYSKNHLWAFLEKSGIAKIGLDDFILQVVGEVSVKPIRQPGELVDKGDPLATLIRDGKSVVIKSPVSGRIAELNPEINTSPGLMKSDPYGEGWLFSISPTNWKSETGTFFMADEAVSWIKKEVERFRDFLVVSLSRQSAEPSLVALQEGGEIRREVLSELDEEIWKAFEKDFLS